MEHLFNYTTSLSSEINSLIEDMAVLQKILKGKKNSQLTKEKLKTTEKEIKKKVYFLRVLEQVSYLENYKNDIKRLISSIDTFLEKKTYSRKEIKKISYFLSSVVISYDDVTTETTAISPISIQHQTIGNLEETIKVIEEILLSFYGLTSPINDLEQKLIKSVEALFSIKLENLKMKEKLHIEDFFNHIQEAFQEASVEGWEQAFMKCTEIINTLKTLAGIEPASSLNISIESVNVDDGENEITFEPWDDDKKKDPEGNNEDKQKDHEDEDEDEDEEKK